MTHVRNDEENMPPFIVNKKMYEFKSHTSTVTYGELNKLLQATTGLEEALARETRCSARQAMSVDKKLADITADVKLRIKNSEQKIQRNLEDFDQRIGVGVKISTTAMSLVKKLADIKILELSGNLEEEAKQNLIDELTEMRAELNGPEANVGEGNAENRGNIENELNEDLVSENDEEIGGQQANELNPQSPPRLATMHTNWSSNVQPFQESRFWIVAGANRYWQVES